jgi:hypothetical protein
MRPVATIFASLLLLGLYAASAPAGALGVPSPQNSTIPTYFQLCPLGDLMQSVVVRDIAGQPVANSVVLIDFCACPGVTLCAPMPGGPSTFSSTCQANAVTDANGVAAFPIRGGGVCSGPVPVTADGVLLGNVNLVVSPDQDGSLVVDGADAAILGAKIGGPDRTGDLDGNGVVDAADVLILSAHHGHTCEGVVPAVGTSWGRLKQIYR